METKVPPVVIPMWLTGFDELMPDGRPFPYKYIPKIGVRLGVTFGQPISADEIRLALDVSRSDRDVDPTAIADEPENLHGWLGDEAKEKTLPLLSTYNGRSAQEVYASLIRQKVTAIIQRDVEALGRTVSGDSLQI